MTKKGKKIEKLKAAQAAAAAATAAAAANRSGKPREPRPKGTRPKGPAAAGSLKAAQQPIPSLFSATVKPVNLSVGPIREEGPAAGKDAMTNIETWNNEARDVCLLPGVRTFGKHLARVYVYNTTLYRFDTHY